MKDGQESIMKREADSPVGELFQDLRNVNWQDVDTDKMKAILEVQERLLDRQAEEAYNRAFTALQPELPVIERDGSIIVKGKLRSKYATFEAIMQAVAEPLRIHGFSLTFNTPDTGDPAVAKITGKLLHADGHAEHYEIRLPVERSDFRSAVQDVSSTISFGKRVLIKMALNLVEKGEETPPQLAFITEDQVRDLETLIRDTNSDLARFLAYFGIQKLQDLSVKDHKEATSMLAMKLQRQQSPQGPSGPPAETADLP